MVWRTERKNHFYKIRLSTFCENRLSPCKSTRGRSFRANSFHATTSCTERAIFEKQKRYCNFLEKNPPNAFCRGIFLYKQTFTFLFGEIPPLLIPHFHMISPIGETSKSCPSTSPLKFDVRYIRHSVPAFKSFSPFMYSQGFALIMWTSFM